MRKATIHFKNEPFTARMAGKQDEPVQFVPAVYDAPGTFGIGIFPEEGDGSVWGLMSPRNMIAAWRATEIILHFDVIEGGTLCAAYYTGLRDAHTSDVERHVKPTIAKIGREIYDEIMAKPIPEQIIRAMLDNQGDDFAPGLYPITDEIRAGTIEWRQEFADAGISHPDEVDAKKRAQEETIAKFERLLVSYAGVRDLKRQCNGMWQVESALLTLVEEGADQEHPDHVLVALAGVVGELATAEFVASMPFGPRDQASRGTQMARTRKEALVRSAEWLSESTVAPAPRWQFWKTNKGAGQESSLALLKRLLDEYFPPEQKTAEA